MIKTSQGITTRREIILEAIRRGIKIQRFDRKVPIFKEFVNQIFPNYVWSRATQKLAQALQLVFEGKLKRLIIQMPPRHGKSELASRLFPAFCMLFGAGVQLGLCSYAAEVAQEFSVESRSNFIEAGGILSRSTGRKSIWATVSKNRMWATGVSGQLTGKGFTIGIIDDAVKNDEEALSPSNREKLRNWYKATFFTRQMPGAAIVLIGTRWHHSDLIGSVLEIEREAISKGAPTQNWHIFDYEAIKTNEKSDFPSSCTVESDWRREGEPLAPEWIDQTMLESIRDTLGPYWWSALFQQKPVSEQGSIFRSEWFNKRIHISMVPKGLRIAAGVDLAFSIKSKADYTVLFPIGTHGDGIYYLFRPLRVRMEAPDALPALASRAKEAGCSVIAIESVAAQSAYVQLLRKRPELAGTVIIPVNPGAGDKELRARGWSPLPQQGLFVLVSDGTGWETTFLDELTKFPFGDHDDQIDAVFYALAAFRLSSGGKVGATMSNVQQVKLTLAGVKPD